MQRWNQLDVNVMEAALAARTHASCSVVVIVSLSSVQVSLPVPITPTTVLSKRDP